MPPSPIASVIVPCFNAAGHVAACLGSILGNSFPDFEIVAVDDASTDGTVDILADLAARDPRITILRHETNKGVSAARNTGLAHARGRYVFFVDPDDTVSSAMLGKCVERLEATRADFVIFPYAVRHGDDADFEIRKLKDDYDCASNSEIRVRYLPRIFGYSLDHVRAWNRGAPLFERCEMGSVCRCAYRRDMIERNGIRFDETLVLNEDAMFNCDVAVCAASMAALDEPFYFYTIRAGGAMTSQDRGIRMFGNKLRLLRKRQEIDRKTGGALADSYAGSCVFSLLEFMHLARTNAIPCATGAKIVSEYATDATVRQALRRFPLSVRHPLVAIAVALLRARFAVPMFKAARIATKLLPHPKSRYAGLK